MKRSTRSTSIPIQAPVPPSKKSSKKPETVPDKSPKATTTPKNAKSKPKSPSPSPVKPAPKKRTASKDSVGIKDSTKTPAAKQPAKESAKDADLKKVKTTSGCVPVDEIAQKSTSLKLQVYTTGGKYYAATLNQSNVCANNNKFYIIQILVDQNNTKNTYFYNRWGRVGVVGQNSMIGPIPIESAILQYNKKLRDKTVSGDYIEVEMNYDDDDKPDPKQPKKSEEEKAKDQKEKKKDEFEGSTLHDSVKRLIQLIFDMKMMNQQMKEIGYDATKMPLGKLAKSSIEKGYQALNDLMEEIKGKNRPDYISQYNNAFYSNIPHNVGFTKMSSLALKTQKQVKDKLEMLQSLSDIKVFTKLLEEGKVAEDINELDSNYLKLNMNINPVDPKSQQYLLVQRYITNTHASTHGSYSLDLEDLFCLDREDDNKRFLKDIGNTWLLWHGSRLTNYVGILSQGLRIAPPEAPVTGYMFGKGVYFADMVSKSANYCFTNPTNNTGLMLLCEVALGDMNEKFYADYYANLLPPGKSSTKGVGKTAPGSSEKVGDVTVPTGLPTSVGVTNGTLQYNEFIVYDVKQIKMKYLLRVKFNYKKSSW